MRGSTFLERPLEYLSCVTVYERIHSALDEPRDFFQASSLKLNDVLNDIATETIDHRPERVRQYAAFMRAGKIIRIEPLIAVD